jgi:hypothetical protein
MTRREPNAIAEEVKTAYEQGRKVLVLTERTEHLDAIKACLDGQTRRLSFCTAECPRSNARRWSRTWMHCRPTRRAFCWRPASWSAKGFDHPPLDTLVLAMPVSWKGTLQQYAGRLHREHASKTDVRIIDFVDTGHPALLRMWDKRQRGYRAMGYRIGTVRVAPLGTWLMRWLASIRDSNIDLHDAALLPHALTELGPRS